MDVTKQTKLYAQYSDHNYGNGKTEEVSDLQTAVNKGLEIRSPRFKTFEKTIAEIDGEVLEGQPKNQSANIYVGVGQVFSLDDVIAKHEQEYEASMSSPSWVSAQFSHTMHIRAIQSVVESLKAKEPDTKFIAEGGQRGDFIELNEGEMVFDREGEQLWPKPENKGFVKIHYPASDAPEI